MKTLIAFVILAQSQLYCWRGSNYGTEQPPVCALSYADCQALVSHHGGQTSAVKSADVSFRFFPQIPVQLDC